MVARATRDYAHAIDHVELLVRQAELVDVELPRGGKAAHQRVAHHARLLADLLHHEVGIPALFGHIDIPVDMRDLGLNNVSAIIGEFNTLGRKAGELPVLENHDVARRVDKGDDVGGNIAAVLAATDDYRAVLAGNRDDPGLVRTHGGQTVGTHHVRARLANRSDKRARLG